MGAALRGNLRDFGISEVFQLIGQQCKTGVLEVEAAREGIHVAFLDGSVAWAVTAGPHADAALGDMLVRVGMLTSEQLAEVERGMEESPDPFPVLAHQVADVAVPEIERIEDLVTRETLFRLLRWSEGSFHFHARPVKPRRPGAQQLPAEQILMDGLRMVDEWSTFDPAATREETVFQRSGRFEAFREANSEQGDTVLARAERIFLLVDGRTPMRRIVDLARTGSFEGARLLSELLRGGVIEPLDAERSAEVRKRRSAALASTQSPRALVAAVLPFVVLVALTVAALMRGPAAVPEPALEVDALREAQLAFETRRVRNALAAWRFAHGREPRELDDLVSEGWLDSLADASGGSYHLSRQRGALVLLSPEY